MSRRINSVSCSTFSQSWLGIWGSADWIYCISDQAEHLQRNKRSKFQFADVAPQAVAAPSWVQKFISVIAIQIRNPGCDLMNHEY